MADNFVQMMVDGHRILPALLADIEAAERAIHVSMFLFFRDPIGEEVAEALIRKARAGVAVRVLLNMEKTAMGDPFSTGEKEMMKHDPNIDYDPTDVRPLCKRLTAAGAQVQDTNIDYDLKLPGLDARLTSVAAQIRGGIAIDDMHIDHRKIVVIDGRVGWCGGANVGAQYMHHVPFDPDKDAKVEGEERKLAQLSEPWWKWHDSLTRFVGPIAAELDAAFYDRWVLDGGQAYEPIQANPTPTPASGFRVRQAQIFCNEPDDRPNAVRALYVRMIEQARTSIFIENPYLYQPTLCDALCKAKSSQPTLAVTLIVPSGRHNDNSFSQDAQEHEYARFLECGIEVYEYQNHFNHLKTAVFDERFSIHGSTNLNCRSLEDDKDFELVVLIDDPPLAAWMLEHVRDADLKHAQRISHEDLHDGISGLRRRVRDPRTLALLSQRLL